MSDRRDSFWKDFPGLVWSNSKASDSVMIGAALTRPRFHEILAICEEFGLDRVSEEWKVLRAEGIPASHEAMVNSMLENLTVRFSHAQRTHSSRLAGALP